MIQINIIIIIFIVFIDASAHWDVIKMYKCLKQSSVKKEKKWEKSEDYDYILRKSDQSSE